MVEYFTDLAMKKGTFYQLICVKVEKVRQSPTWMFTSYNVIYDSDTKHEVWEEIGYHEYNGVTEALSNAPTGFRDWCNTRHCVIENIIEQIEKVGS